MPNKENKMQKENKDKTVVIVGAGVSGAFAARKLLKLGYQAKNITFLEAKDQVGGKLESFKDPKHPGLISEKGAVVLTSNYPTEVIAENKLGLEKLLSTAEATVELRTQYKQLSPMKKFIFSLQFMGEMIKFNKYVHDFNRACKKNQSNPPHDQQINFLAFAQAHGLNKIASFMKMMAPGFGYGPMDDTNCYAYRMINYMGYLTIPTIVAGRGYMPDGLVGIKGGYQSLIENMLTSYHVETSAHISQIDRSANGVIVRYEKDQETKTQAADLLLITTSPLQWPKLGMQLSTAEQACLDTLKYYRYPIAICRLKGLPPQMLFKPEALEASGYGHIAFLSTRDNRDNPADGRLCTVYVNLPEGATDYQLEEGTAGRQKLMEDLYKLPGVTGVEILETRIWEDYNPTVSFQASHDLKQEEHQHLNATIHPASFRNESFETVCGAANGAEIIVDAYHNVQEPLLQQAQRNIGRFFKFFTLPRTEPFAGEDVSLKNTGLTRS